MKLAKLFSKKITKSDLGGRLIVPKRSAESFFPAVKDQNDRADIMALDPMGNQYQLTLRFWHNQASRLYNLEGIAALYKVLGIGLHDTIIFYKTEHGHLLIDGAKGTEEREEHDLRITSGVLTQQPVTALPNTAAFAAPSAAPAMQFVPVPVPMQMPLAMSLNQLMMMGAQGMNVGMLPFINPLMNMNHFAQMPLNVAMMQAAQAQGFQMQAAQAQAQALAAAQALTQMQSIGAFAPAATATAAAQPGSVVPSASGALATPAVTSNGADSGPASPKDSMASDDPSASAADRKRKAAECAMGGGGDEDGHPTRASGTGSHADFGGLELFAPLLKAARLEGPQGVAESAPAPAAPAQAPLLLTFL